jgi:hypothetical protein
MSKHEKSDVLVHFDEDSEEFVFYSVRSRELEAIREKNFDGARLTVESFKSQAPDEAEKELGSIIFSLIDSFSNSQINIRDYKAINEKSKLEYISELEKDAHNGSPEAMYYLSIEYFGLARKERSFEYLEKSEELLKLSSNLGYEDATQKLKEHWNLIKNATLKALNSGNDTNK